MWSFLVRNVIMPATSVLTPHKAWRYYRQYAKGDFDPPEKREARVLEKLKAIVAHAYEQTDLYREKLDAIGMKPADVQSFEDFRRIPPTTKHEFRKHFPEGAIAKSFKGKRMRWSNTSGTTGKPFMLVQDIDDINCKYAARLRARALEGSFVGDRTVRITPNECQPCLESGNVTDKSLWDYFKSQAIQGGSRGAEDFVFIEKKLVNPFIHRRLMLPPIGNEPGEMGDTSFEYYLTEIERYKPKLWVVYPLYAYLIARYIRRTGRAVPDVGIVDLSGGVASQKMRQVITDVFGAPCYESYGGCEFGRYANECSARHGKMHIVEDHVFVDIVKPDGSLVEDGEIGNQIVTSLTNYALPTLRMEQGDTVAPHGRQCECGRTSRLIDVRGRMQTLLVLPDGRTLAEKDILDALLELPGVEWFQLIQHEPASFELRVIPDAGGEAYDPGELTSVLKGMIGAEIAVDVKSVDFIAQEPSGKYMHVKSCTFNAFRCVPKEAIEVDEYTDIHVH